MSRAARSESGDEETGAAEMPRAAIRVMNTALRYIV